MCAETDESLYSIARLDNLVLIRLWSISLKKFRCCSKFLFSLTQGYRTKLRAIVPNVNYFKPIILKFKTTAIVRSYIIFVYIRAILFSRGGKYPPRMKFFTVGSFKNNISKYAKLTVKPYICDKSTPLIDFFLFSEQNF